MRFLSPLRAILVNPIARVWCDRLHAVWATALLYGWLGVLGWAPSVTVGWRFQVALLSIIFFRHVPFAVTPKYKVRFDAFHVALSLGLNLLEMAGVSYLIYVYHSASETNEALQGGSHVFSAKFSIAVLVVELAALAIVALFHIAILVEFRERILHQRPKSLLEISMRHLSRPLVSGESGVIIFTRAFIIYNIGVTLPIFALYRVVLMPATAQTYSKPLSPFQLNADGAVGFPPGNASLLLSRLDVSAFGDPATYNIQTRIWTGEDRFDCKTISLQVDRGIVIQCPYSWYGITNVSISLSLPPGISGVYVVPIQGVLLGPNNNDLLGQWLADFSHKLDGAPLFGGSALAATFTWTQTNVTSNQWWHLLAPPTMAVYTPDISGLQPYTGSGASQPNNARLTLIQRERLSTRLFIDTPDSTVLNGIATLGGFWTALNGAFILIFGADMLYFALGWRSFSALGLAHIFQRKKLKRQWHKDFPALHTKGGKPGSESAGIVAFLRERFVDVGEDPDEADDLEAQRHSDADQSNDGDPGEGVPIPASPARVSGSEDIPLLEVDLGRPVGEMLRSNNRAV